MEVSNFARNIFHSQVHGNYFDKSSCSDAWQEIRTKRTKALCLPLESFGKFNFETRDLMSKIWNMTSILTE